MARAKRGVKRRRRHKKVLNQTEGFVFGLKNKYRRAVESLRRAGVYAYRDRKAKKRDFRSLWISRITAAANQNGLSYSQFMGSLIKSNIGLNRKVISEIAIHDPAGFGLLIEQSRKAA